MSSEGDSDIERLRKIANMLGEYYESVQIFVTRHDAADGEIGTVAVDYGSGNLYARLGQARDWLDRQREISMHQVRSKLDDGA